MMMAQYPNCPPRVDTKLDSITFTPMIVPEAETLRKSKPSTSVGPDGIPHVLSNCSAERL